MNHNGNPQLGPATALLQLLQEHPELPAADWRITRDGHLSGTVDAFAEHDVRPVIAAYARVLGGCPLETEYLSPHSGGESLSVTLHATWRDVPVTVWASCPVSVLAEAPQVVAA